MPLYKYNSFSRRGKKVTGTIDASTLQAAKELLRGQGLMPITLSEVSAGDVGNIFTRLFEKKIDVKSKVLFTKQLGVLLRSGVPLLQGMELLAEQFEGKFKRVLIAIKDGLKEGQGLAQGMAKYPRVFSNVYIQLVRAGEATGKLESILENLTVYLEKAEETRKRVKKALSYPIMMLSFAVLVVMGMLMFVVPRITETFKQMGKELPGPTLLLMNMSDALLNHYIIILVVGISLIVGISYWKSTKGGRRKLDELFLKLPLISYFSKTKAVVQFTKTLGMLLESGVNLAEALDIVTKIVTNSVLTGKLEEAREKIIKQGKIAQYLKETGIFPPIASYMISTGEESGKLAEMLLSVGQDYDRELTELTDGLTAKINPIMMLVMGVIVTFIVLAIFMPIMQMGDIPDM